MIYCSVELFDFCRICALQFIVCFSLHNRQGVICFDLCASLCVMGAILYKSLNVTSLTFCVTFLRRRLVTVSV